MNRLLPSPYIVTVPQECQAHIASATYTVSTTGFSNKGYYIPLRLPVSQLLVAMSVYIGATGSGNIDLGIYDELCSARLASMGSTAAAVGINTFTLPSPLWLPAGKRFYIALSNSSGTTSFVRQNPSALVLRGGGVMKEDLGSVTLPNPATGGNPGIAYFPNIALTFRGF